MPARPKDKPAAARSNDDLEQRSPCPCGSGREFGSCCGPFLDGRACPSTARALMRSRYSAHVRRRPDYLRRTWHPDRCPAQLGIDPDARWLGLKLVASHAGGNQDSAGTVEFVARFKVAGRGFRIHERSCFKRLNGSWVYVSGEPVTKPSGKKRGARNYPTRNIASP